MTVNDLKTKIEAFATAKDLTYIRGTLLEANFKIDDIDTSKRAMIHFDQTEIESLVTFGSMVLLTIPTTILFLQIDPESDSDLDTLDSNIEDCEKDALTFYNYLLTGGFISDLTELPPLSLERLPAFKQMDAAFSGVLFNCSIPILTDTNCFGFPYTFPYPLA